MMITKHTHTTHNRYKKKFDIELRAISRSILSRSIFFFDKRATGKSVAICENSKFFFETFVRIEIKKKKIFLFFQKSKNQSIFIDKIGLKCVPNEKQLPPPPIVHR